MSQTAHTQATGLFTDGNKLAFAMLRTVFTIAPILFGLDKFARVLTDDWERYLAPWMNDIIPGDAHTAMMIIGAIEIVAGLVVAFAPSLVACWSLCGWAASLLAS